MLVLIGILASACMFDGAELQGQLDDIKDRISRLQTKIEAVNKQLQALNHITSGNVITSVSQDSDGKYVITYLDSNDQQKTVVIATMDQMVNVPLLGVELDAQTNLYYWTVTVDGRTTYLMKESAKVPVSGFTPVVSVDAEGYWTVDGERLTDAAGNPIAANDGESCLFKTIETNESGDLVITQGNGKVITIPVQQVLNLTLSASINTTVVSLGQPMEIAYDVTGTNASDAMVAVAEANGVEAVIDRQKKVVTVTFPDGFMSGYLIVVANDFGNHTVLRPVFFEKAKSDKIEIRTAEELVAFASDVNAGTGAEEMKVFLMNDIDMKDVSSWTPIGNGLFHGSVTGSNQHLSHYSGPSFKGIFDGQGYSIKNLKMVADLTVDQNVYGLFGILDGATVRNLTIGAPSTKSGSDVSELTFHAADSTDAGVFAGVMMASTMENCTNYVPMHVKGTAKNTVRATMAAFAGFVYANETTGCVLKNLTNYGSIKAEGDANTTNGAASVMAAGIAGITNGTTTTTARNYVYNCVNYGDMTSSVPRTSGIIAAINQYTDVELCKNYGNQTNSNKGTRVGMITCTMANYTSLKDCENHGDAIMTGGSSAQVGGLVCLLNAVTASISGGGNYGDIIGDIAATSYKGTLVGNFSRFEKVENVVAGGGVGSYNGGNYVMEQITAENYMKYIGKYSEANAAKITNIIFPGPDTDRKGIRTAEDLVEFATLVNAGESYEKFQDENGGVNLLNDIDMSSVTSWTPIGYASCPAGAFDAAITGNAFTGRFSGNNYKIKNLKMVASGTEADKNYGFFGTLAPGATVENIVFDETCSLEVTATKKMACGVVAGYVYDATVRDVQSYAKMTFNGKAGDNIFMSMALIGQVYCNTEGVTVDSVHNYGDIVANNSDNTKAGATAYHAAGIVGFAHALVSTEKVNTISSCSNYGDMTTQLARTSGIVAAANRNTEIFNCENNGNQLNSFYIKNGARPGNITCITTNGCSVTGCKNLGNLTCTNGGRPGGIVSLPNSVTFTNCANYGVILSDDANRGVFYGYNGANSVWVNCTAGGKVGTYNNNSPVYDSYPEAEKESYLGKHNASKEQTYTNITYLIGTTDPSTGGGDAEYNILFIGNSFTKDAVEHLPGLLAGAGNAKVNMTHIYYGGQFISTYNSNFSDPSGFTCYTCKPGATSWSNTTGVSIEDCCNSAEWDVVTIQEHTGNWCAWDFTSTSQSDVQSLISKIKATQKGTPKFYYIMSQAYYNMAKIGSASKPYITWEDQEGMYNVIVEFGKKMMDTGYFEGIIATGTMLQNLRTSPLNTPMDLTRDGYHMDGGLARYGAACTVFETIITPKFGTSMDGNTFRYDVTNTSETQYTTPVTSANAPVALQAARYAIQKPYQITDMSSREDNSVGDMDYEEGTKE